MRVASTDIDGLIQTSLDEIFTIREYFLGEFTCGRAISNVWEYDEKITVVKHQTAPFA